MSDTLTTIHSIQVFICEPDEKKLDSERAALDVIGDAISSRAQLVVIPVERLADDFFRLKTGLAGQIIQKFATYHLQLAILGDITPYIDQSHAFRDFIYETNQGKQLWFIKDIQELHEHLHDKPI